MKMIDVASLLSGMPAELVLMSTYNFEPDFFERRILRSATLAKARRIAILMDADQWRHLQSEGSNARWLNSKYLVVPIRVKQGVFHPKLTLVVRDTGCHVLCGSGNLSRCGCTHNLEIINSIPVEWGDDIDDEATTLCSDSFNFFKSALKSGVGKAAEIAKTWLNEVAANTSWVSPEPVAETVKTPPVLWHSLSGPLWQRVLDTVGDDTPRRMIVVSPYYDHDASLVKRLLQTWPDTPVEVVAQQLTSSLPVGVIQRFARKPQVFEISAGPRRLHAKMFAWEDSTGRIHAVVGSANFSTAAFDGRNIEACFYLICTPKDIDALFAEEVRRRRVSLDDFQAAEVQEPTPEPGDKAAMMLHSVVVRDLDKLVVNYEINLVPRPTSISVALRVGGEPLPRCSLKFTPGPSGETTIDLPESMLQDAHGTILAILTANVGSDRVESQPTWVILEHRLTHERGNGENNRSKTSIEETGEGLAELLDEIAKREGISGMVDYLNHLNIRFADGHSGRGSNMGFRLKLHDPYHPDVLPDWWDQIDKHALNFKAAIYAFCDRHEKQRLRRHAQRGNINGIENFIDIFSAIIRLLYVYMHRPSSTGDILVKKFQFIGRACHLLCIAVGGIQGREDTCRGYLDAVHSNMSGEVSVFIEKCVELNVAGHLCAVLLLAQYLRYDPSETPEFGPKPTRPSECLTEHGKRLKSSLKAVGLGSPTTASVRAVLEGYRMLSESELDSICAEYAV